MPLILGCLALAFPRFVIILLVVLSDYIGTAYQSLLWPFLGFFFAPTTTLAYAFAIHTNGSVSGLYALLMVVAVLIDLGLLGSGGNAVRRAPVRSGVKRVKNMAD